MYPITPLDKIDYLVIGHLTRDLTPEGPRMGGTAAYASLTARALGLRVGIVTSWGAELPLGALAGLPIVNHAAENSTTFENIQTSSGRKQVIHSVAHRLDFNLVPEAWRSATIVHLGPVAQEVEPALVRYFPAALIGLTPQGWLREWDSQGRVHPTEWLEASFLMNRAAATIISAEDVGGDEGKIDEMAAYCQVLAVTENAFGSRLYWHGDVRRFPAPQLPEVDPTGAGDVYAAAFFYRLHTTHDPWEAARFATQLASISITRPGLSGIPTAEEVQECLLEVT
jgi:sugar/nucleoside kinase (ribokinase family)